MSPSLVYKGPEPGITGFGEDDAMAADSTVSCRDHVQVMNILLPRHGSDRCPTPIWDLE